MYNFIFTVRRILLAVTCVNFIAYPQIQAMIFLFISLLSSIYILNWQPNIERRQNNLEVFNELCVSVTGYLLFMLTDFVDNEENDDVRQIAGACVIGITLFNFLANMGLIFI